MERYDIAIIGTGPAGLSAALTAKIRNKKILLLGSGGISLKIRKAHTVQNYLGLPSVGGAEMEKAFRAHLADMDIAVTEARVSAVYPMDSHFGIQTSGEFYEAESVVLATGVTVAKPYPGETELLGRGVSYCATCDGPLYKKKRVAVIASSAQEETEADFLAGLAAKVYYFPLYADEVHVSAAVEVVREKPEAVIGTDTVRQLKTPNAAYDVDGVFILRESIAPSQLMPGLTVTDNHVAVNRLMETNVPGCFACGDIVGKPYQYIKAAGEGNVAALSAAAYLDRKNR
ncbi:NAD(P)/FAD-dependent oxidoreductase [Treponema brennaborense]|uniref:Thioredoxin-disulfide reductase n=1 Tax=Treponema brennaborense (strain DSM 12168 / CIP 105900 / DD5/3) TaxID=906968 RepID=F4LLK0_TREBD|nr:NAD(P)/FAD-dependent oxidoreductase [Treponema brennaborense]AEE16664.1 Thioredoxin-disulfide reductase [Treponema brennaborense DSM 12168]